MADCYILGPLLDGVTLSAPARPTLGMRVPDTLAMRAGVPRVALEVIGLSAQGVALSEIIAAVSPLASLESLTLGSSATARLERLLRAAEMLRQLDVTRGVSEQSTRLLDALRCDDGLASITGFKPAETLALADALALDVRRELLARERLVLGSPTRALGELLAGLREASTWGERPLFTLGAQATEAATLTDGAAYGVDRILRALETLRTGDRGVALVETAGRLLDGLRALDLLAFNLTAPLAETVTATNAVGVLALTLRLSEPLPLGASVLAALELLPRLRETLRAGEVSATVVGLLAGETLGLVSAALLDIYLGARAVEALVLAERPTAARELALQASELARLADALGLTANWSLADGLLAQVLASPDAVAQLRAAETFQVMQVLTGAIEITRALTERLAARADLGLALGLRSADTATLSTPAMIDALRAAKALERWQVTAAASSVSELTARLTELGRLLDSAGLALAVSVSGSVTLADTLPPSLLRLATLRQRLGLDEAAALSIEVTLRLLEAVTTLDVAAVVEGLTARETATLADALARAIWTEATSTEALAFSDAASRALSLIYRVDETLDVADTAASVLELLLRAGEQLAFIGKLPLEDGDYQAWVINTDSLGVTQYAQFPMESLATHEGRTFGVTATGLYELIGDDDDGEPIAAYLRTGDLLLGGTRRSSVPRAYLYVRQGGDLLLKTIVVDGGHRRELWYRLAPTETVEDAATRRIKLGRGVRGVSWAFEISNIDGADFDLRGCEVLPVVLSRRV